MTHTVTKKLGNGGIRTHASEETGALNQRLRPLGHATRYGGPSNSNKYQDDQQINYKILITMYVCSISYMDFITSRVVSFLPTATY